MSRIKNCMQASGAILLAFGAGILMTFLLSCRAIVILEAIILIAAGVLYLLGKER